MIELLSFLVADKILLAFDFSEIFENIKPKINPANPATTGMIMSSIVLIWLYKKTYTSEVYINSIMTCIELTN